MKLYRFFEFTDNDLTPLSSFKLHDTLNPQIWDDYILKQDIHDQLMKIANDYVSKIGFPIQLDDIILTGSLANLNYSVYSDFDLHFVFDFSQINSDVELVKRFLDADRRIWNLTHDIKILGYDVEIYSQDTNEPHSSSGIYSLLQNQWIVKPTKQNFIIDENAIKIKAEDYMSEVDSIEIDIKEGLYDYEILTGRIDNVWDKIKTRNVAEGGEFSIENLVFKLLRRNGYIEKVTTLRTLLYDKQFK